MHAFILAGGFATRLWPLTEKRAKPLLPLAGKPILTHIVEKIPADIPITVSTNAVFKEGFEKWKESIGREVEILIEDTNHDDHKLGALGAVAKWVTDTGIDEDVLLIAGDNYIGFDLADFLSNYNEGTPLIAALEMKGKNWKEEAKAYGTIKIELEDQKGQGGHRNVVRGFIEKSPDPSPHVSIGCYILPKDTLPTLVEFAKKKPDNIGGIFEELLRREERVECYRFFEPWFDIGSFDAYLEATKALVSDQCIEEEGASRDEETKCEGSVVLGPRSKVINSSLKNVVLFEDCEVEDCELENCILDHHCYLKGVDLTGKMLRESTRLVHSPQS